MKAKEEEVPKWNMLYKKKKACNSDLISPTLRQEVSILTRKSSRIQFFPHLGGSDQSKSRPGSQKPSWIWQPQVSLWILAVVADRSILSISARMTHRPLKFNMFTAVTMISPCSVTMISPCSVTMTSPCSVTMISPCWSTFNTCPDFHPLLSCQGSLLHREWSHDHQVAKP